MSVQRNVVANYAGSGWAALLGLAVVPVYLHLLGIESYGLIGFLTALQAWLFVFDLGLSQTLNREMARFGAGLHSAQSIRDLLRTMELLYGAVALLLALAVAAASGWIVAEWLQLRTLSLGEAGTAAALMGAAIALQWMGTLYRSAILGLQDQVWLAGFAAAAATARAVAAVAVLSWISPTVLAFVLVQCAVSLLEAAALAWRAWGRLPRAPRAARFSLDALRGVWRFAAGLALITVLATLLTQVDKLLLSRLLTLEQFGYFSLALAITGGLASVVVPIRDAAYPRLSELVAAGSETRTADEYHRFAQLLAIVVLPAALVLSVFPREVVLLWTGDAVAARVVAPILSIWVLGTALNGLMNIPYAAQLAHGWARLTIAVNSVAVAVMIPAMLLLVPRWGAVAAAWIWLALNVGYTLCAISMMHRRILVAEKWRWYVQGMLLPLLGGGLALVPIAALHQRLDGMSRAAEAAFLAVSMIAVTLATAASTGTGREILRSALCLPKVSKHAG